MPISNLTSTGTGNTNRTLLLFGFWNSFIKSRVDYINISWLFYFFWELFIKLILWSDFFRKVLGKYAHWFFFPVFIFSNIIHVIAKRNLYTTFPSHFCLSCFKFVVWFIFRLLKDRNMKKCLTKKKKARGNNNFKLYVIIEQQ